ncbi:MAG: hypothetical protein SOZ29_00440, partial [Prevotella sp.]|nr:hypothetical protein [Prevotella sp.]
MGDGRAVSAKAFIGSVEKTWGKDSNEGHFHRKRLQEQMQSFALAFAKLCVGVCKALRWRLQSFAFFWATLQVGLSWFSLSLSLSLSFSFLLSF